MTPADLEILIQQGEGTTLEFKEAVSSSFARELVALANTVGGKILLGVRDDHSIRRIREEARARGCPEPTFEANGFLKHLVHFRLAYLQPALRAGLIAMTIPDKPRSSRQRYRLTPAGRRYLRRMEETP